MLRLSHTEGTIISKENQGKAKYGKAKTIFLNIKRYKILHSNLSTHTVKIEVISMVVKNIPLSNKHQ